MQCGHDPCPIETSARRAVGKWNRSYRLSTSRRIVQAFRLQHWYIWCPSVLHVNENMPLVSCMQILLLVSICLYKRLWIQKPPNHPFVLPVWRNKFQSSIMNSCICCNVYNSLFRVSGTLQVHFVDYLPFYFWFKWENPFLIHFTSGITWNKIHW